MVVDRPKKIDMGLVVLVFVLVVFGLVMLASASSVVGFAVFGDSYHFLKHQVTRGLIPGLFLFFILSKIDYRRWKKMATLFLVVTVVLLLLVFIPGLGATYNQARSWINVGGFSLQPSELAKLTLLIYLAAWLSEKKDKLKSFSHGVLPFMLVVMVVTGLIAVQPDLGTMMIIVLMSVALLFVAGISWSHLAVLLGLGVAAIVALIKVAPYRVQRLTVFLNPEVDPQGIGYHINQALIAIGSGGLFGLGLGHSRQKFQYLPEVAGDSVFAVMGEELGFVFACLLVVILLMLIFKILKLSKSVQDDFGKYFAVGLAVWIGGQAFVNIGAMVGIMPLTGVPLPFVSFGGTALMTVLAAFGILVNISQHKI